MATLSARADAVYQNDYHHQLRSRLWAALSDTKFDDRHGDGEPPGFVYSNPFPPRDMQAGDERTVLVAAPEKELLAHVAADLLDNREFNISEMPFYVEDVTPVSPDVGEPGSTGTIETGTGVLVRIPPWRCDEYNIDHPGGDTAVFWRPEHTMEPFVTQLENNLDQKHDRFCPDYLPGPSETDHELFDSYELLKTFAVPVTVTKGQEMTFVLSKWRFEYQVRDDDHRRHLNLALDTGIGERNGLGLGFINITDDE